MFDFLVRNGIRGVYHVEKEEVQCFACDPLLFDMADVLLGIQKARES